MGNPTLPSPSVESSQPPSFSSGWGRLTSLVFRFVFVYWSLYSLPVILRFPTQLIWLMFSVPQNGAASGDTPGWFTHTMTYLAYPGKWFQQAVDWFTPWISYRFLGVDVQPPTDFTGSGDRLYDYCICFAFLVLALASTVVWSVISEFRRNLTTDRQPSYDRLHTLLCAIVRFHLMYQMVVYGTAKVWCAQFPPIDDFQLETKYGESSPMGLLWRFMQYSQPYTAITGIVEFCCGLLLISRRTTFLGALCTAAATLQVFLLNMCYDVPVKLMSGQLLLMALTLILPDVNQFLQLFVFRRPTEPRPLIPLFGSWKRLNRTAVVLGASLFLAFAGLSLLQAYQTARSRGILAPENALLGRWVGKEFLRDGQKVPFPEQPDNPPLQQLKMVKWQGESPMPAVIRMAAAPTFVTFAFEDGSGISYRNTSRKISEIHLFAQDGHKAGQLEASFPEPDKLVLDGAVEGQTVHMTLQRIAVPKKDYLLRNRGFHWVQDKPFNR